MKVKVVSKDVSARENGIRTLVVREYSLAHPRTNCGEGVYELKDHVGQEALNLNSLPKLGFVKRIFHAHFSNHLLKNI